MEQFYPFVKKKKKMLRIVFFLARLISSVVFIATVLTN